MRLIKPRIEKTVAITVRVSSTHAQRLAEARRIAREAGGNVDLGSVLERAIDAAHREARALRPAHRGADTSAAADARRGDAAAAADAVNHSEGTSAAADADAAARPEARRER